MNKCSLKFSVSNLVILFLCVNCTQPVKKVEVEEEGFREIDIMANIANTQNINLSTIASSIDYCILETDKKCLIPGKTGIYCVGDYIVSMSALPSSGDGGTGQSFCYVFERKTGKFVRQISRVGQGPEDYQMIRFVLDSDSGQICLLGNNKYLFFNLDGTLSHKISGLPFFGFTAYKEFYVAHITNGRGNATIRVAFYDNKTGELVDSIPNYRTYQRPEGSSRQMQTDGWLHKFDNNLYYKDIYCDTLYQIKDFTLQPRYIFNTGGRTVPYEAQIEGRIDTRAAMAEREFDRWAKYIVVNRLFEDANNLYFEFEYNVKKYRGIYNKAENKTQIMPPVSLPLVYHERVRWDNLYGFENDLDGGLPFWPTQMVSDKEMMCVYSAEELLQLDASKITDPNLKRVLGSLEEDSNPVVAIVTLKPLSFVPQANNP